MLAMVSDSGAGIYSFVDKLYPYKTDLVKH